MSPRPFLGSGTDGSRSAAGGGGGVGDGLRVDTALLRGSSGPFKDLGDRMDTILSTLRTALDGEGECWGADDYGKQFVEQYAKPRDSALQALPAQANALRGIGARLTTMADNHEANETATSQTFRA